MAQHFLLSSAAKTLSLVQVARMSEKQARIIFQKIRWADNDGKPYCPRCGCVEIYTYAARPVWKCEGCGFQFRVTSETIFADHKRPLRDYLLAIAIFANGAKGVSALQLSRDLASTYRTAFVLAHKIRESLGVAVHMASEIGGEGKEAEIDGAYFGGHAKPHNNVADRRIAEAQTGKRQVVVIIRERNGKALPFVVRKEKRWRSLRAPPRIPEDCGSCGRKQSVGHAARFL